MKLNIGKILNYLTILFIVLYTFAAITVSLNRYWQHQTAYYDFGVIDSAIWKVAHFQLPIVDHHELGDKNVMIFASHFSPSVFLLSPLYWFTNRQEILLIAQSLLVGIGALIAYFLAKKTLKSNLAIFALIVAFLGYVGLQNALISEFHDTTLSVLPLMLIFLFIYQKKWIWYFIMLIILLGLKESFAGLGVGIGLYIYLKDRANKKIALLTILISLVWGYLALKVVIPYFSQGIYLYSSSNLPNNPISLINSFLFPDLKYKTMLYSFATFGFLPIFDITIIPAIFENFLERFVLSSFSSRWDLGMHYNSPLSPLLFIGALAIFKILENKFKHTKLVTLLALTIIFSNIVLHRFILRGPLGLFYNPDFYKQNEYSRYVDDFLKNIPKDGVIYTQNDLAGRLSHQNVKTFRPDYKVINPDYIVLNLTPGQTPNAFSPLRYDSVKNLKDQLLEDSNYTVQKYGEELYIFSKYVVKSN
ncbi:MAG: DUF2079 domain-containing protein [Candidatus Daviesbacteria bacterium]|nr:DUF2079 domain-containing protein [Candidatus Daviesbacteria bacterium]